MPLQYDLFGGAVMAGSVQERIEYILENFPECRDDYHRLMCRYWLEFDGLKRLLGDKAAQDRFEKWFVETATRSKTLQNRCGESQHEHQELDASPEIRRLRDAQATAGPVGSK